MNSTIEQELALHGHGFFQTVGDSMEPLLHNRKSTVVIERVKEPLKKYDVALYRRPTGEYVLHRIIKVCGQEYLICGDNRTWREKVPEAWIIGVMTGYYGDERNAYVSCESKLYRSYMKSLGLRHCVLRLKSLPGRVGRKLLHRQ